VISGADGIGGPLVENTRRQSQLVDADIEGG